MFDVSLDNWTPFTAVPHVQMDQDGQELLLVVVCATFSGHQDGPLALAIQQDPLRFVDEYWGDPERSSVRWECDISPCKPRVDILVNASAYSPGGIACTELEVEVAGAGIRKRLRVSGDRSGARSSPAPFCRMPVVYERAFGGTLPNGAAFLANPVGVGYRGAPSADPAVTGVAANVEYVGGSASSDRLPAGLGCIARHWSTRAALAGTYDQAWKDSTWPLLPRDLNPHFYQAAPEDQQTDRVEGGETVHLTNLTPSGAWTFTLPRLDVPMRLLFEDRLEERDTRIDTVSIDAERRTVTLKWRVSVRRVRNAPHLRSVVIGHPSAGWWTAQRKRKIFLGRPQLARPAAAPLFQAT